jgi:IMP dehydrogenase
MREALSFDDVLLIPQYSDIYSRKEIKIKQNLKNVGNFSLPIISSPMDTITEGRMSCAIGDAGGISIVHRYNTIEEQTNIIKDVVSLGNQVGAAVGVGDDFLERSVALANVGVSFLCIDVAHGHHSKVRSALEALRAAFSDTMHIMAGNVATLEAFNDLSDWGADSIRIGIGGGSICSTRIQTGHGMPTLQSVMDCAQSDRDAALIADGGIRTSGDIVKALAAGADFVMVGSLLAGTDETPGSVIHTKNGREKVYRGMASKEAQRSWRNRVSSIEGVSHTVPLKGPAGDVLEELRVGITSGISYSGAHDIGSLQSTAKFIQQTTSGQVESSTHIKRI